MAQAGTIPILHVVAPALAETNEAASDSIQEKIKQIQKDLAGTNREIKLLQKERDVIANNVTKGRALLVRLKTKLTEFQSTRKKLKDGMEAQMLCVLREIGPKCGWGGHQEGDYQCAFYVFQVRHYFEEQKSKES